MATPTAKTSMGLIITGQQLVGCLLYRINANWTDGLATRQRLPHRIG